MLTSYLKIALRYLAKNKLYSFINMAGLSVSLACAMLMILYTKDEWSFDKFHQDVDAIHLIAIDVRNPDGSSQDKMGVTSIFHGPKFQDNLPEVQSFVRLNRTYRDIKLGEEVYSQLIMQADPEFFTFFTFPLLRGNPQTALQQPRSVVISQEIAVRHFGTEDALNKTILFEKDGAFIPYTVTGVAKRSPKNSSIQFEMVLPLDIPVEEMQSAYNWVNINMNTFVKLHPGSNAQAVESKMQQVFESESKEAMEQVRSYGFSQSFYHQLQPLAGIHLSQEFRAEVGLVNASNPVYSYILSGIALFVLALACINFVNLTIARSARRAKEIGIRKVVGGGKRELIWQFLGESFLLCCFAFMAALLFAQLLLPVFNNLVDKQLSLSYLLDARLIILYSALLILTGVLAGFYPALVLSSFSPVQTLYKRFRLSGDNYLQKSLIVFQFALATVMIIATMTIYLQFDHLTTKELGYTPDDVVQVKKRNLSPREAQVFGEELAKNPNILSVSPHLHWMMNGKINGDSIRNFYYETVDENFFDLMKIQITRGRNFSPEFPADSANAVIVNEAFVRMAGWSNPIGQEVQMFPFDGSGKRVIGVVKDYNFEPLTKTVEPQLFSLAFGPDNFGYEHLLVRIQPNMEANAIPYIEKTFKQLFPAIPYSYQFYTEVNLQNYEAEAKWKQVILLSALLTVFLSCSGLFGLSILTAESRFKEISIRKVLGATVQAIVFTLYKDLLALIALAMLIGMPLAYYACNQWLENYPYRIEIGIELFIGTGLLVLVIAMVTVSYQTIKTALLNPAETLKRE